MKQEVLAHFPLPMLTVIGMLIFIAIFVIALIRVLHPANRSMFEYIQDIPLKEESHE
ncbi:cbb3-type cytochrome c oxidase subunit 3 [bacterium]|nr:cbb3-type cytochrome c oxidase subunit 3 [bacterium]